MRQHFSAFVNIISWVAPYAVVMVIAVVSIVTHLHLTLSPSASKLQHRIAGLAEVKRCITNANTFQANLNMTLNNQGGVNPSSSINAFSSINLMDGANGSQTIQTRGGGMHTRFGGGGVSSGPYQLPTAHSLAHAAKTKVESQSQQGQGLQGQTEGWAATGLRENLTHIILTSQLLERLFSPEYLHTELLKVHHLTTLDCRPRVNQTPCPPSVCPPPPSTAML